MNIELDQTAPGPPSEELDSPKLEAYLREHLPQLDGLLVVEQFPHGHSNLTYLIRLGKTEMVLRRPPFGNQVQTAHDMSREFRVLSKLSAVFPQAPRPLLYCDDQDVLGSPFYIMQRCCGMILRKSLPLNLSLKPETTRRLSESLVVTLARLHAIDYQTAGLADLGKPAGYVSRQISGWIKRYAGAQTETLAAMDEVAHWLSEHTPPDAGVAVIHNDFKYDNVVLDPVDIT